MFFNCIPNKENINLQENRQKSKNPGAPEGS
jgi:hypothetical protein